MMINQDIPRFAALIAGIGEVYDKSFTAMRIDAYWNVLKDFKFEEVQGAFYRHLKNPDVGMFLPKPADIIAAIDGSPQNQALLAWTKVVSAIKSVGSYTSIAFDDPLIHVVIDDMSGWRKVCLGSTDENLPFVSKEFRQRYCGYVANKPLHYPKYFIGIIENQNRIYGYICGPPVLFGDTEKAKQVIANGSYVLPGKEAVLLTNTRAITKN